MSGQSAYLKKRQEERQAAFDLGEEMGMQKMWDYVQVVLTDPDVMSTHKLTRERMEKVFAKLGEVADRYSTAFTADVEADVYQEELDARLREIWGDDLDTFYKRYPFIKKLDYSKPMKGWK